MGNSTQKITLYRYFDSEGRLLYVGITGDNTKRQSQHRRNSFWFGEISSATYEHFSTRQEALDAETKAIQTEKPKHNQQGGFVLAHTPKVHMIYLTGRPDGGHDQQHKLYAEFLAKALWFYDGKLSSAEKVLVAAMLWAKAGGATPNVQGCALCVSAYTSDWFRKTKSELKRNGDLKTLEVRL